MGFPTATSTLRVYQFRHIPAKSFYQTAIIFSDLQAAFAFADNKLTISWKSLRPSSLSSCQMLEFDYDNSGKET